MRSAATSPSAPRRTPRWPSSHSVVPALFEVVEPVAPPAGLKDRILAAAAADTQRVADAQQVTPAPPAPQPARDVQRPRVDDDRARWLDQRLPSPGLGGRRLAAVLAVVALGAWNVQLQDQNRALVAYQQGVVAGPRGGGTARRAAGGPGRPRGRGTAGLAAVARTARSPWSCATSRRRRAREVYEAWLIAGDRAGPDRGASGRSGRHGGARHEPGSAGVRRDRGADAGARTGQHRADDDARRRRAGQAGELTEGRPRAPKEGRRVRRRCGPNRA